VAGCIQALIPACRRYELTRQSIMTSLPAKFNYIVLLYIYVLFLH